MHWLALSLVFFLSFRYASPYFITIDAAAEDCYFERVEKGTKMGFTFEIAEGGFLDIDARVISPDNKIIYQVDGDTRGMSTFSADLSGSYTFCFSNLKSTMTPKVVMFSIIIEEPPKQSEHDGAAAAAADGEAPNKLEDMIKELSSSLWTVKHEQEYMEVRDRNHRAINENTNFRVVVWSFFEAAALVCMTMGQVYYLKRFFEVRRVV